MYSKKNKLFLVRPKPFADESLYGYVVRLAYVNGLPDKQFYSFIGKRVAPWRSYRIVDRNEIKRKLIYLTGHSVIENLFDPHKFYKMYGKLFNYNELRFCPACLGEKSFYRSEWHSAFNLYCRKHSCYLVYKCSICSHYVDMLSVIACTCTYCGSSLISGDSLFKCNYVVDNNILNLIDQTTKDINLSLHMQFVNVLEFYIYLVGCHGYSDWSIKGRSFHDAIHILDSAIHLMKDINKSKRKMLDMYCYPYSISVVSRGIFSWCLDKYIYDEFKDLFISLVSEYAENRGDEMVNLSFIAALYKIKYKDVFTEIDSLGITITGDKNWSFMRLRDFHILVEHFS